MAQTYSTRRVHRLVGCLQVQPQGQNVVVFGDTHGQLHDVLKVLEQLDAYSAGTLFVFNGASSAIRCAQARRGTEPPGQLCMATSEVQRLS